MLETTHGDTDHQTQMHKHSANLALNESRTRISLLDGFRVYATRKHGNSLSRQNFVPIFSVNKGNKPFIPVASQPPPTEIHHSLYHQIKLLHQSRNSLQGKRSQLTFESTCTDQVKISVFSRRSLQNILVMIFEIIDAHLHFNGLIPF